MGGTSLDYSHVYSNIHRHIPGTHTCRCRLTATHIIFQSQGHMADLLFKASHRGTSVPLSGMSESKDFPAAKCAGKWWLQRTTAGGDQMFMLFFYTEALQEHKQYKLCFSCKPVHESPQKREPWEGSGGSLGVGGGTR